MNLGREGNPGGIVRAVAQPQADSPGPSCPPIVGDFKLARVAQPVAVATGEHGLDDVQSNDPAPAVPALKPRSLAAEPARCPGGGDMLHALPAGRRQGVGQAPGAGRLEVAIPPQVQHTDVPTATSHFPRLLGAPSAAPFSVPNNRNCLASLSPSARRIRPR